MLIAIHLSHYDTLSFKVLRVKWSGTQSYVRISATGAYIMLCLLTTVPLKVRVTSTQIPVIPNITSSCTIV
jgi:hypothetical protein